MSLIPSETVNYLCKVPNYSFFATFMENLWNGRAKTLRITHNVFQTFSGPIQQFLIV